MSSRPFTKEDFAKWNTTTSVFYLPKRLVGKGKIPQLRADFVKAIGAEKVLAVQILPNHKVRVQFKSPSFRVRYEINGLSFRGVTLTPFSAYEEVKSVFVDRAPLQMVDNYLYEALAPYGRVISVQHLTVRGFPTIKTGTRMVSMSVNTSIPAELKVAGFTLAFRYRGQLPTCYVCQEVGHTAKECPKSRKATHKQSVRKQPIVQSASSRTANTPSQQREVPPSTSKGTPASSKPPADLRDKINKARASEEARKVLPPAAPELEEVKVAFDKSPRDLRDKLIARRNATPLAPSTQAFDLDLSVRLAKSTPSSSPMVTDFSRQVTHKPGKKLEVVVSNPASDVRKQGKSRHVSSSDEESDASLAEVAVTPKPRAKRVKRFAPSQKSPGHKAAAASSGQTTDVVEDCLDGSNIIDPLAPQAVAHMADAEGMEAQSAPVAESPTLSSPVSGADNHQTLVAEPTVASASTTDPMRPPQDIPLPEEETFIEERSTYETLKLCDMQYDLASAHNGSDVESLSGASTTSSLELAAELTDYLLQDDVPDPLAEAAAMWMALAASSVVEENGSSSLDH
jgi:hypothetical protein